MTQPQSPNGDAKAIEHDEARSLLRDAARFPVLCRVRLGAYIDQQARAAAELEAVRLELDRERQEHERVEAVARFEVEGLEQQLTTERARAEEAETRCLAEAGERRRVTRELAAANARAGRLGEALSGVVEYWHAQMAGDADVAGMSQSIGTAVEALLSAAPQASTEEEEEEEEDNDEERDPVNGQLVSARAGTSPVPQVECDCAAQLDTLREHAASCSSVQSSPIPQVAQASAHVWQSDGTHSVCSRCGVHNFTGNREAGPCPVAQASTLPWDQPRTTSAELAGGDPFAKAPSQQSDADAAVSAFRAELVAALRADPAASLSELADRLEGK